MGGFEVEKKRLELKTLETAIANPNLWQNRVEAEVKTRQYGKLKNLLGRFDEVESQVQLLQGKDKVTDDDFFAVKRLYQVLEEEKLFSGKYDGQDATLSIFAGAGGEDAEDWAGMLLEMYTQYALKRGWKTKILDESVGDFQSKTGSRPIRNAVLEIKGDNAYGYLKRESGVHRLVRISPFSSKQLRHTSFALIEILPDLPAVDIEQFKIPAEDLKVEFFRSGGPGGQNVNKVETAVRIIHTPTGLSASCQVERSQSQNRERALKLLTAKIVRIMEDNQIKELKSLTVRVKPEWGSQIRSYVLHPYKLVKDHRTNVETSRTEGVLCGDLDIFIDSDLQLIA